MATPASAPPLALLEDRSLGLAIAGPLVPLLERWIPRIPETAPAADASMIRVRVDAAPPPLVHGDPLFTLDGVRAHASEAGMILVGPMGSWGSLDLARGLAELRAARADEPTAAELYSMLTASAALLAGRRGRAVIHAAAAIAPDGGAWMLVGDAWAGKSTTTATLVAARWDYLSDDQVVLGDAAGGLALEGWPRTAHLDAGWRRGAPEGRRVDADLARLGGGRWRRAAPLAGILLPGVAPDEPTVLAPAPASRALEALLRQSPWLLADRDAAPGILALLTRAASLPAFSLRLGRDTFARPDALLAILTELPARGISAG